MITTQRPDGSFPGITLVGCYFHVFDDKGEIVRQGAVRADIGGGYYLVNYFGWVDFGGPDTLAVVPISEMVERKKAAPGWQFYERAEDMTLFYETLRLAVEKGSIEIR